MTGIYEWYAADSQRLRDELDAMREEAAARGVHVSVIERERAAAERAAAERAQPGGPMPEGSPPTLDTASQHVVVERGMPRHIHLIWAHTLSASSISASRGR